MSSDFQGSIAGKRGERPVFFHRRGDRQLGDLEGAVVLGKPRLLQRRRWRSCPPPGPDRVRFVRSNFGISIRNSYKIDNGGATTYNFFSRLELLSRLAVSTFEDFNWPCSLVLAVDSLPQIAAQL